MVKRTIVHIKKDKNLTSDYYPTLKDKDLFKDNLYQLIKEWVDENPPLFFVLNIIII